MGKTQTQNYNLTKDDQNEFYDILMHAQNMDLIDEALKGLSDNKVSKVEGKGLSTNDYTTIEKQKLAGIEEGATNYQHPETHSIDIITETTAKKIMTSTERTKLAGIASGAQVNTVTSVAGRTGAVSVTKADVGLNLVDNLSAASIRAGTTKTDVGLSAVLNYGVATTAEAQAGAINTKYMTPLRVKEAIDANIYVTGSYIGNGVADRVISLGFTPKAILIDKGSETRIVLIGDPYKSGTTVILEIISGGLKMPVANSSSYNGDGIKYTYIALK